MEFLIYTSKAATILTIFYVVYVAVLRKDTLFSANRHYLLSGILAAIAFPFIEITKTIQVEIPLQNETIYNERIPIEQIPIQEAVSVNWWQVAFFIYLLGACFMLLRFIKQLISLIILLYKYPSVKKDGYRYIITSENTPPFSFFRNIVYNSELHTQQELEMILKHEEVHASQWHSIDIIATNLLLIFQWINPLAWLYKKGVEENLEYIADSATAQQIESVKQYQLALVKASSTSPIPALTNNFYQSFIKKRIVMLNKSTSKKINAWKLMLVLPLLAVFLWSFNTNEVVTYTASNSSVPAIINPYVITDGIEMTSENKILNESKEISGNIAREVIPEYETNPVMDEPTALAQENSQAILSEIIVQDNMITITKNTTKKELEEMKSSLNGDGVNFEYSNLVYNERDEIIGISINYKSKDGKSGSYSVNSDTPINTVIIKTNGDRVSVRSEGNGSYSYSSDESREEMQARTQEQQQRLERQHEQMKKRKEEMQERQGEMELRQVAMIERKAQMEGRHAEMELRRAESQYRLAERRSEMREQQREVRARQREMNSHGNMIILEEDASGGHSTHVLKDSDGTIYEIQGNHDGSGDVIIVDRIRDNGAHYRERLHNTYYSSDLKRITKNSTKADLEKLKTEFKSKGVSFSYNGVKRNDAGEITKIKLKVKDNKGSSSSSSYNGEGQTIHDILIDTTNGITIMKGGSH